MAGSAGAVDADAGDAGALSTRMLEMLDKLPDEKIGKRTGSADCYVVQATCFMKLDDHTP